MLVTKEGVTEITRCYCYELTATVVDDKENLRYTTYGVSVKDEAQNVIAAYPDVSTKKDFVQHIVDKCNQFELDAVHLEDLLLDSIG